MKKLQFVSLNKLVTGLTEWTQNFQFLSPSAVELNK